MEIQVLTETLRHKSISPTAMRLLVLDQLSQSEVAMSVDDLDMQLQSADRVTIYRTLKKFEEHHLVHPIEDGTGAVKYALCESNCQCTTEFTHAHFHCIKCEQTYCLRNIQLPEIKLPKNFEATQSSFILKGICDRCKS